ncbi:MAG: large-conductance mechanosensitive channel protein MscL [Rubripirellula sp.]
MGMMKEFREFAMRGSVVDLAVGVVIGAAFGKIVSSFVANIVMPPLNLLTAKYGVNFSEMAYTVKTESPKLLPDGTIEKGADGAPMMAMQDYPILNYGPFIQTIVDFLLVAAAIFLAVKVMNSVKARYEKEKAEEAKEPSEDVLLLREIRDSLKKS